MIGWPGAARLSIRARLALWYGASVAMACLIFAVAVRTLVRTTLQHEFAASIESSADAVSSFFRLEYFDYREVPGTLAHLSSEVVFPDRVVEFVRPDGSVAFTTGPGPKAADAATRAGLDSSARIQRLSFPLEHTIAPGWVLRVSASAASLDRSLERIDNWLMIGVPLGILLAAASGWWLAGRTLRPVGSMAAAAIRMASVAPTDDGRTGASPRLPIDNPSDELGQLGTLFNALLDHRDGVLTQQRRFLADAAHELRTPIARMLGTVDLALLDTGDQASHGEALQHVRADLTRATRLVEELLQLARADAAGALVHCTPGFVDDVVVDAVRAWQSVATGRGVALTLSVLDEAPANIDPVYLERLVGILVDNAIRYTDAGGAVDVRVRADGMPRLEVSDTGIGIPTAERQKVFDRFYRGVSARTMSPDGSGLGLPIARWIAMAHGARLTLEAGPGGTGTLATVIFPTVAPPPAAAAPRPA